MQNDHRSSPYRIATKQISFWLHLAQVGTASHDDLNRDPLIVRQHYIIG
jgi:hypothetical protein